MEMIPEPSIGETFLLLVQTLATLLYQLAALSLHWILWILWAAWWLRCVNAKKFRYVLACGGWAPALLLIFLMALVWSRLDALSCDCLGFMTLPNFWWQLGYLLLLAVSALFFGWLQSVFHWTPPDIHIEPAHAHGHGHHGGHGHDAHGHDTHDSHGPESAHP